MTTPFKITELGFYKMRNGEKCKVVDIDESVKDLKEAVLSRFENMVFSYLIDGRTGRSQDNSPYDIISKWVEQRVVEIPECAWFMDKKTGEFFCTAYPNYLTSHRNSDDYLEIKTYPACTVTVED
jgi:hypothetical protein